MKQYINKSLLALSLSLAFASCNVTTDDVELDRNDKPVVNVATATVDLNEDGSAVITVTADRATNSDMKFKLFQVSGNAISNDDYSFETTTIPDYGPIGGQVTIPAFTTEGSVVVNGIKDFIVDNKTAVFELRPTGTRKGVVGTNTKVTLNIIDYTDDNLGMVLSWDDGVNHLCDVDFDAFLNTFEAYMFTGNCPELVMAPVNPSNLITGVLSDGTKALVTDLWSLGGADSGIAIPLKLTVGKVGQFSTTLDLGELYTTDSAQSAGSASQADGNMLAGFIVVENGKYKIYDANNVLVYTEQ